MRDENESEARFNRDTTYPMHIGRMDPTENTPGLSLSFSATSSVVSLHVFPWVLDISRSHRSASALGPVSRPEEFVESRPTVSRTKFSVDPMRVPSLLQTLDPLVPWFAANSLIVSMSQSIPVEFGSTFT